MALMTGEYPKPISRPAWLTARARNAVNRPIFIGAVGVGSFVLVLVALLLAPQQVRRAVRRTPVPVAVRPDTSPLIAALTQARNRMTTAESSLVAARARPHTPQPAADAPSLEAVARRDTLTNAVNDLDALIARVEGAPVAASYRALGESPQLANSSRVKALLDSLGDVEKDREAFGSGGGADPVFVALSARATEIGRAVQAMAQERREALRQQIAKVAAPTPRQAVAEAPAADTAAWIAARDSAQSLVTQANTALSDARQKIKDHDLAITRANSDAQVDVPPIALLGAALVFGIALGFGSAFLRELRHPRISGDHEVERMTGARVLATVRPRPRQADRHRRFADTDTPRYFDPAADGYQLTYLHVARAGASRLMLVVAGEETGIAAIVAANVAAIAADEARSTILIDADSRSSPVAAVLRTHAEPGLIDIIDYRRDWADVTTQAVVGRDRVIDIIPSGISTVARDGAKIAALFRRDAAKLVRQHEAIVIVVSVDQAKAGVPGALPIPDTILCARVGHTRIADLQTSLNDIRAAGGNPLGVVLWNAPPPNLPSPERLSEAQRPVRTEEMQTLTSAR